MKFSQSAIHLLSFGFSSFAKYLREKKFAENIYRLLYSSASCLPRFIIFVMIFMYHVMKKKPPKNNEENKTFVNVELLYLYSMV